jgi:hypothetical protein
MAFTFPRETERANDEQRKNVLAEENLFNTEETLTMQYFVVNIAGSTLF